MRGYPLGRVFLIALGLTSAGSGFGATPVYFPPYGSWERQTPAELGIDPVRLQAAIDYSIAHQNSHTRDLAKYLPESNLPREPHFKILGPTRPRGGMTGLVIYHGKVAAAWGDPDRVDMTFSATKTFVTTVVGLAWDRGMIRHLTDRAADYLPNPELFSSPHNAPITWDDLLRQSSNWIGTLWEVPDSSGQPAGYAGDPLFPHGTVFDYNDVRVNLLSLVALNVWRQPLPQVLRREVMDPIGASNTWRWEGYENSWVTIDGQRMQSVSGGGHYGGGMFINAWDMARFGYLFLHHGAWAGRRIISEAWITQARTPGPANPAYGFANWYPNTGKLPAVNWGGAAWPLPSAPKTSVLFHGSGANIIYLDWEHDLLVVVRWINDPDLDGFIGRVLAALPKA